MQEPKKRGAIAFLCFAAAATRRSASFPTAVSAFHHHASVGTGGADGRCSRRCRPGAGDALRSLPRQPLQLHRQRPRRSLAPVGAGRGHQQRQQPQQKQGRRRRRQREQTARGTGHGLVVMSGSGVNGGGSGGGGSGDMFGRRDAAALHECGGTRRTFFKRPAAGKAAAVSGTRRCASADDDDDNYGSPDYSEYGYEPEFELQGDREHDPNADAETLAKWREEKLLENDRWQFGKYGAQNVGNWIGSWQEFVAQEIAAGIDEDAEDGTGSLIGLVYGKKFVANTRIDRRVVEPEQDVKVFEHWQGPASGGEGQGVVGYSSAECPPPVVETLSSDSFRGGKGIQVVGNTYTMAGLHHPAASVGVEDGAGAASGGSAEDQLWVEVGLRAKRKDIRMRCLFNYGPAGGESKKGGSTEESGANRGVSASASAPPGVAPPMAIRRVFLVREGLDRLPPEDGAAEPELYGAAGKGLYDPSSLSRSPLYFSIYAEGGLTIRFPLRVEAGQAGVLSVDWTAGATRFQADRVFEALDGSLIRLEVTEIGTEDAEIFLPMEKF